jgi:chloride channel protein, CIC family
MGAVFAAAAQAPITSVLIIFELTGDYRIILPLMFAIVLATGLSRLLTLDTIYTLKLRRRGIDIRRGRAANLMEILTVGDAMKPVPSPLSQNLALNEMIDRFTEDGWDAPPLVDEHEAFQGVVTSRPVEQAMRDNALDATASALAQDTPTLRPDQSLEQALGALVRHESPGLPVLDHDGGRVIGWLTHRDVLQAYSERLERGIAHVERRTKAASPPSAPVSRRSLARLRDYRVVDLDLTRDEPPAGQRVMDISWPPSSLLLAIRREGTSFVPTGQTRLQKGDRLAILVAAEQADALVDAVEAAPARALGPEPRSAMPLQMLGIEAILSQASRDSVILEPNVAVGSAVDGKRVRDLALEQGVLLVALRRNDAILVPKGDTRLEAGDHIVMIVPSKSADQVLDLFRT